MAREMSRPLKLFVAAQPTRGVDVGSIEFIHQRIVHERDIGTAVLLVSSELDEVIGLADRIAVMYRGRILGIVGPDTPREEIGLLMAGITDESAAPTPGAPLRTRKRHERAERGGGMSELDGGAASPDKDPADQARAARSAAANADPRRRVRAASPPPRPAVDRSCSAASCTTSGRPTPSP